MFNKKQNKKHASEFLAQHEIEVKKESNVSATTIIAKPEKSELSKKIIAALKTVYDPEIPVNIYDLGLIYNININDDNFVTIDLTLTSPGCPVAHTFPHMVKEAVVSVPEVSDAAVELVWDPPWSQQMMSEAAKLELGMF